MQSTDCFGKQKAGWFVRKIPIGFKFLAVVAALALPVYGLWSFLKDELEDVSPGSRNNGVIALLLVVIFIIGVLSLISSVLQGDEGSKKSKEGSRRSSR